MNKFSLLPLLFAGLLSACSSNLQEQQVEASSSNYWQSMEQKLQNVSVFKEQGRIGFITSTERGSCNYDFSLDNQDLSFELISPIGSQIAHLYVTDKVARLSFNQKIYKENDTSELLRRALGIKLSDRDLTRILLGIPKGDIQRDPEGRIISALIDDYTVNYAGFKVYNGYALPTNLTITGLDRTIKIRVNAVNEVK